MALETPGDKLDAFLCDQVNRPWSEERTELEVLLAEEVSPPVPPLR